ncbi:hypothetical protein HJC23_001848 [Cyclotella cryptica]|uniref:tRNA (guanine(37)-N1)-methyltransferase n=1 Tax=Cyclotella cryptica TaxID=29204 RepID=A0ABD3PZP8_9STRA
MCHAVHLQSVKCKAPPLIAPDPWRYAIAAMCFSMIAHSIRTERKATSQSSSSSISFPRQQHYLTRPPRCERKLLWFLVAASLYTNMSRIVVLAAQSSAKGHCRVASFGGNDCHLLPRPRRRDCRGISCFAAWFQKRQDQASLYTRHRQSIRRHFDAVPRCNNHHITRAAHGAGKETSRQSADIDADRHDERVSIEANHLNWRSFSDQLSECIRVPSISVPSQHVHWLLSHKDSPVRKYLATSMPELEGVHPRVKVVVDDESVGHSNRTDDHVQDGRYSRKRILLMGSTTNNDDDRNNNTCTNNNTDNRDVFSKLCQTLPQIPHANIQQLIHQFDALPSSHQTIHIPYQNQPVSRILSKLLPPDAQPPPSSYEQIGHVAHFNLRPIHIPHGKLIGSVLLDRYHPTIRTVVNKQGEVGGPYRTYHLDLLAGDDDYSVHVVEHGASLHFDLRKVYWCTRLEGERTYMIQQEFRPHQRIADAFCGVGALCIRAAMEKKCRVVANDWNPDAVAYCLESARRNGIEVMERGGEFGVQCGDAREFIMNLGMSSAEEGSSSSKAREAASVSNLPDHLILNFPLDSPSFLNALRWWPSGEKMARPPRVHVYTFARGDDVRTAADVAIDMVADGLLPEGGYIEPSKFRGVHLDSLGCNVTAREVRDAAPGKLVICVSFSVTRMLLRRMQGDYGLF